MLKRIVHPSGILVTFVTLLHLNLSKPQHKHLLRTADAIIVCEGRKTLANLYRQWVEAPDVSALADYFRVSPWESGEISQALAHFAIEDMVRRAEEEGAAPIVWASIDDSATRKDKDTHALEAVDWIFDHSASGKGQKAYCKGVVHISLRIQIGSYGYTFAQRLYLREKTVRRLNRKRRKGKRLRFKSKYCLAREMLEELRALLPEDLTVYVLFDRWYGSGKLIKFIRRQGWHVICALKRNRTLDGTRVDQWDQRLRHKRYTRIRVPAADGTSRTYLVRSVQGHLSGVPFEVCVLIHIQTAQSGQTPEVLSVHRPGSDGTDCTDLIRQSLAGRSRLLVPQTGVGPGGLSSASLRGYREVVRRAASGVDLSAMAAPRGASTGTAAAFGGGRYPSTPV